MERHFWRRVPRTMRTTCRFKMFSTSSTTASYRHIDIVKFLLHCPAAFHHVEEKAADVFGVTHFRDNVLLTSIGEVAALLLKAACRYLTQDRNPKEIFLPRSFYAAESHALRALSFCFAEVWDCNSSKYYGTSFQDSLNTGITLSSSLALSV